MNYRDNNESNETAPFNSCDYRCECCDKKAICVVYQKELERSLKHIMNGEDPADMNIIFNDLKEDFADISTSLQQEMQKRGIKFSNVSDDAKQIEEDEDFEDSYIREHPLYENVQKLYDNIHQFLACFFRTPVQGDPSNGFFEDLEWHHVLILSKIYRLLFDHTVWDDDRLDEFVYEESILTMEAIKKSISIIKNAVKEIGNVKEDTHNDIEQLKADLNDVEIELDSLDWDTQDTVS